MNDEVFDLFARGIAQSLGAAEIGGVRLNEVSVELMLADELAEPVANPRAIPVAAVSICRLRRGFPDFGFRFAWCLGRVSQRSDLFDRADANAVGFSKCSIHSASFRYAHFGAVQQ